MTDEPNTRPTPVERPVPPADWIKYVPDIVKNAMLTMWNYICDDTKCHPLDIEHGKGKFLTFEPKHWAQFAGDMAAKNIADLIASERPVPQVREAGDYVLVPRIPTERMIEVGCDNNPTQWNEGTSNDFAADVANDVYVSMVREALTARPSDAAVAWRWKYKVADQWQYCSTKFTPSPECIAEKLYALPPDEPARVTPTVGGEALADENLVQQLINATAAYHRGEKTADGNPYGNLHRVRDTRASLVARLASLRSPTIIASEKEPVQADSGASERVCDHPVTEKAALAKFSKLLECWREQRDFLRGLKERGDLTRDWGECSLNNACRIVEDLTAAITASQVIANPANLLRSQPEPASEKEYGKAVGEKRVWCELCGFAVLKSKTEGNCSYWDCPIDRISALPAASLIAKGEGES